MKSSGGFEPAHGLGIIRFWIRNQDDGTGSSGVDSKSRGEFMPVGGFAIMSWNQGQEVGMKSSGGLEPARGLGIISCWIQSQDVGMEIMQWNHAVEQSGMEFQHFVEYSAGTMSCRKLEYEAL
jgi:hypothetical protein